ncbi:MAG: hypothetical protein EOO36_03815 [Cytophagaceae bacterium]|nr:MAG: hypothetical protein EOO36_03815 [Cytophagaceae bacterium]
MQRMADYLIYQAYGSLAILDEALFSLLSYLRQPAAATVLVYTDNTAYFQRVLGEAAEVVYVPTEPAQWQAWRGEIDFVHRVKIEVLRHAAAHYPGQLLYVDTDTVFLQSPAALFAALAQGQRVMHLAEGRLSDGNALNRKLNRALRPLTSQLPPRVTIGPATHMYNAGVLGLRSTDAPLLDEVLALTEQLYRFYPKHVMEQLAFSVIWAREGPVQEATPWVYHYWNLKEIRPVLHTLFAATPALCSLPDWQARATQLDVPALAEGKAAFRQLPGWHRAVRRWLGRDWQLPTLAIAD